MKSSPCDFSSPNSFPVLQSRKCRKSHNIRKLLILFLACLHMTSISSINRGATSALKTKLIRNRKGRTFFLGITAIFGLLALGMIFAIIFRWQPLEGTGFSIASVSLLVAAAIWTLVLCFSHRVFRLRGFNTLIYLSLAITGSVFLAKCTVHGLFVAVGTLGYLLLFLHALLQIPSSQSRIAYYLHPFVDDRIFSRPFASTPRTMQHRQRALSIFRDWPAPQPFPALALYTYNAKSASELSFGKRDDLTILDCRGNWWQARHPVTSAVGFVPSNFIAVIKKAKVVRNFTASGPDEVSVLEGQVVEVMEEHESMSLVRGVDARIGSVDSTCLQTLPPSNHNSNTLQVDGSKENLPPPKLSQMKSN